MSGPLAPPTNANLPFNRVIEILRREGILKREAYEKYKSDGKKAGRPSVVENHGLVEISTAMQHKSKL